MIPEHQPGAQEFISEALGESTASVEEPLRRIDSEQASIFAGGRSKIPACYRDLGNWPRFDEGRVRDKHKARFRRLALALRLYLAFGEMSEVLEIAKMGRAGFQRLVERCGQVNPVDGSIAGLAALSQGTIRAKPVRLEGRKTCKSATAGYSGLFLKLFRDKPKIRVDLECFLLGKGVHAIRINQVGMRAMHRMFKKLCYANGLTADDYPLNTKSAARQALYKWYKEDFVPRHVAHVARSLGGPDAEGLAKYANGDGTAQRPLEPYRKWSLDETTVHLLTKYLFPNATGDWEELDLARFVELRIVDSGGANLASKQVYARAVNADDVCSLLWDAVHGPEPVPPLIKGLVANEGAGYPAVVIPTLKYACCDVFEIDNALAHLANSVQEVIMSVFGARVILGPPKTPRERAAQESRFKGTALRLMHQVPGSTGSNSQDPLREIADVPLGGRLHAGEIEHALDVELRNENILPQSAAGHVPSLVRLKRQLEAGVLMPKYLPEDKRFPQYFGRAVPVTVRCDLKTGRMPLVNFMYCKYTSNKLKDRVDLRNIRMWIRANPRNLQTVWLFQDDGTFFDEIRAIGRWGQIPSDLRIRRIYGRLKRQAAEGERADDSPLEFLFNSLQPAAARDRKAALELAYVVEYVKRTPVAEAPEIQPLMASWKALVEASAGLSTLAQADPHMTSPGKPMDPEIPTAAPVVRRSGQSDSANDSDARTAFAVSKKGSGFVPRPSIRR